ncbi:MAG TPA: hypothetical protein VEK80_04785, partial [Kribbellaceae bacterium]|nr:hypothetical protein [Kribbellaceae bacterium]
MWGGTDQPHRGVALLAACRGQPRRGVDQDQQGEQQRDGADAERQPVQVRGALRMRRRRDRVDPDRARQRGELIGGVPDDGGELARAGQCRVADQTDLCPREA